MNLEFNKIFAAILVAGITAGTASFVSEIVMHPHHAEEDAVPIEGVESSGGPIATGPTGPEPILELIATADLARGEKLTKACIACHSFEKGGPNKTGPNLWGIVRSHKAHLDGYAYSDALLSMEGNWNYVSLNKFLYKPKDYISGTKMNYIGLKKPEDRAAVIAWLRTMADAPAALPSDSEIAAEKAELAPEPPEEEENTEPDMEAETTEASEEETPADEAEAEAEQSTQEPEAH